MKSKLIILSLAVVLFLSHSGDLLAHEGMEHDEDMETMDHEKDTMMEHDSSMMNESTNTESEMRVAIEEDIKTLPNIGNKICPVSKNQVDDGTMGESVKFVYNEKIYNLCCPMCVKDFKKDPEKYSKIAEEEAAKSKMTEEEGKKEDHGDHDHK